MKTSDKLFDEYFNGFENYEIWDNIDSDWIKEVLDGNNEEYNIDILYELLEQVLDYQKELQIEEKNNEIDDLYDTILDSINPEHLDNIDIAKVLIKLANRYLNDYYE